MSNTRSNNAPVPDRRKRTGIVWGALLMAMTSVGGLLLALEDRPAPASNGLALAAPVAAAGATPIEAIFGTRSDLDNDRWDGIVIHHSGARFGSAATIAAEHQARNLHGLGYHFVIGNGAGAEDGQLYVGYRWLDQLPGAHTGGAREDHFNRRYIGICLIGDGDRATFSDAQLGCLAQVVSALCERLDISPEDVLLHRDVAPVRSPGRFFPDAAFRELLADVR